MVARSGDGRLRLVYVRTFADGNVHRLELPSAGAVAPAAPVLTVASTRMDSIPHLSADGRRLAFVSDRTGELHLWSADPDGANAMQLTTPSTFDAGPGYPRWFPDGSSPTMAGTSTTSAPATVPGRCGASP